MNGQNLFPNIIAEFIRSSKNRKVSYSGRHPVVRFSKSNNEYT